MHVINSSKLFYYSQFKHCLDPQCETYLTVMHNQIYRRALCFACHHKVYRLRREHI